MLTVDEQKNQNAQNTNLDDVLLGKRVKIARKEKRLTQEELAGLCNCTPTHICNIENGKIGISLDVDNSPKLYNSYHFKIVQSISFAK